MHGQWVTCNGCESPCITGQFHAQESATAQIDICGLGFFELFLNGQKISNDVLTPVWTDYAPRRGRRLLYPLKDEMRHRFCFRRWDIPLVCGHNTIQVLLGNGWYNQHERNVEGDLWYGPPCLWFDLTWKENGELHHYSSGPQLEYTPSPILHNNIYTGETQDLRISLSDSVSHPVQICDAPDGKMELQTCPPDRIIRVHQPVLVSQLGEKRIYDASQTLTGWGCPVISGEPGEKTVLRYAECLTPDGRPDFSSCGQNQIQTDTYISCGKAMRCRPHFTWHAFRYIEVEGPLESLEIEEVHTDIAVTGSFSCSSPVLNHLFDAYVRTRLNNMHCGVPSDCPHRERLGYTGDGQAVAMSDMYLLDADLFYRKWIQDILDCQDLTSGHVQHTAPFYGGGGGPGGWGSAIVLVPWAHYQRYADPDLLKAAWPGMKLWRSYMFSRMDSQHLVVSEEPGGWCLGDWCPPEPVTLPEPFVNTCYLARCLLIMKSIASLLGESTLPLQKDLQTVQQAIIKQYWDGTHFAGGIQGADALALEAGLGGATLAETMAAHYRKETWFDTGFLATGSVVRQLFQYGYADEAVSLLVNRFPCHSFAWQQEQGSDTLWERWDGQESHDHPMFGSVIACLFQYLAGIRTGKELLIHPCFPLSLTNVKCHCETRFGPVTVCWERTNGNMHIQIHTEENGRLILGKDTFALSPGKNPFCFSEQDISGHHFIPSIS